MDALRFMVFSRSGRDPWSAVEGHVDFAPARKGADAQVAVHHADRSCVMEIGGVDALPSFTFKYATKTGGQ